MAPLFPQSTAGCLQQKCRYKKTKDNYLKMNTKKQRREEKAIYLITNSEKRYKKVQSLSLSFLAAKAKKQQHQFMEEQMARGVYFSTLHVRFKFSPGVWKLSLL